MKKVARKCLNGVSDCEPWEVHGGTLTRQVEPVPAVNALSLLALHYDM